MKFNLSLREGKYIREFRLIFLPIVIIVIAAWFLHTNITNKLTLMSKDTSGDSGTPMEGKLFGQNEDEYLGMSAKAVLYPARSEYNVDIVITNHTNDSIEIIAACGSYVSFKSSEAKSNNGPCVAVYSMGIEKKATVNTSTLIPAKSLKKEEITLTTTYHLKNNNQKRFLGVTLTPINNLSVVEQ